MWTLAATLFALACVVASARRLAFVVAPTALDAAVLRDAVRDPAVSLEALRAAVASCPGAGWERDLFDAVAPADERAREALLGEQLCELVWRARRWERVPRVCASVASSAGFLFATLALTAGLGAGTSDVRALLVRAIDAAALGVAATSFCVAVHVRARRLRAARIEAGERLVEALDARTRPASPGPESRNLAPPAGPRVS